MSNAYYAMHKENINARRRMKYEAESTAKKSAALQAGTLLTTPLGARQVDSMRSMRSEELASFLNTKEVLPLLFGGSAQGPLRVCSGGLNNVTAFTYAGKFCKITCGSTAAADSRRLIKAFADHPDAAGVRFFYGAGDGAERAERRPAGG